ncbi:carboxylesterase family protein [Streptomyces griseoviridis]|uniref:Carboxylic ester hydrolase n=1 Tax=Streptomyces griseoviridis TaxID=45398 RepID=A0A918GTJ3_STRGD|nr:carboxylesterase family protein [Streptomyces niveoruber]GGS60585.1 carboxylic ester hydrolase [Streptomyces niveoruber]
MRTKLRTFLVAGVSAAVAAATTLTAMAQAGAESAGDEAASYPGRNPVVSTAQGKLRGEAASMVTSFKGIPYAKPPVGTLRWKAPQPAAKWNGVRDATEFGGSCVQGTGWDPGYDKPTLTEDCLYLNVYRPSNSTKKNLPVFVWNHGGGNTGGAGRDTDPAKFVTRQDAVFVTLNYRLGAMGWLYTDQLNQDNKDGAAGNYGLLDQQAALRWVQQNIRAFGGDPHNVTLAGQSAGARNTCTQLAAPGAKGLFDRVILQSGGCNAPARTRTEAADSGDRFAAELHCPTGTGQLACLRAKSPADILAAQQKVSQNSSVYGTSVLPADPLALLKTGKLTNLPVVVGGNSDESQQSVFGQYDYRGNPLTAAQVGDLIEQTYPEGADRVEAAYPVDEYWSPTVAWGTIQSDQRACRDQTLRDRLAADTRTYAYEFAEKDGPAFTSIWRLGTDYPFGATHVNELGYLWDYLGTALPFSADQVRLSDQMISYWGSFTEDGNPNVRLAPAWPRYTPQGDLLQFQAPSAHRVTYAQIDDEHNCALWNDISPAM